MCRRAAVDEYRAMKKELPQRENDGISVTLLWQTDTIEPCQRFAGLRVSALPLRTLLCADQGDQRQ